MHVVETRHVRRFVLRIEPGEDVVASLEKLARSEVHRAGWARGRGLVAWADVASWDDGRRAFGPARHLEGPFTLTFEAGLGTKIGEPSIEVDAMLSARGQSTGGRLVACAALSVECLLEVFEDVRLERQDDDAIGLPIWRGDRVPGVVARSRGVAPDVKPAAAPPPVAPIPTPVAPPEPEPEEEEREAAPAPVAGGPLSWAAVAQASAEAEKAASKPPVRHAGQAPSFAAPAAARPAAPKTPSTPTPQRGDWVEHRQFGLCRVEGEDPDGGTRVRLPSGARKTLRLDVMEILPPRHEADRTVFPVRPRGSRG